MGLRIGAGRDLSYHSTVTEGTRDWGCVCVCVWVGLRSGMYDWGITWSTG